MKIAKLLLHKCIYIPFKQTGSEIIIFFSCSMQLSIKFFLIINAEMPTTVGISTFMSRKNSILGLSTAEKMLIS